MQSVRFEIPPCPPSALDALRRELGVSGPMAQVLVRRGLGEPDAARAFLAAGEEHAPGRFDGIDAAVAAILAQVRAGGRITVHGDYDVDGICSTAVLIRALRALGADVDSYIPDRADGYGLQAETVRRLAARGTRLILTADCAITAVEEVREARELGIEVVVTDHHSPRADGALPAAPIVHPAVCGYPCAGAVRDRGRLQARRRRCTKPRAAMPRSSPVTSTWWRSRPSPTWSLCAARTARSCAAACARWPRPPSPACAR